VRISVVIPTAGRRPELATALERLDRQSSGPDAFEAIVVVDSDRPEDAAAAERALARRRFAARALANPGRGASAARNAGVEAAPTPLVLFIDDDVLADPGLIEAHLDWHERSPEPQVGVLGHVRWADWIRRTGFTRWLERGVQSDYGAIEGVEAGWGRLNTANVSFKRSLLERCGGFDEEFTYLYEDLDLGYRLNEAGLRLLYNGAASAEHAHLPTLEEWKRRMALVAPAERRFVDKHPDVPAYFFDRFTAAAARPPASRLPAILADRGGESIPLVGSRLRRRADLWYAQQLAPAFLSAWAESDERAGEPPPDQSLPTADTRS
jgi:GT2 family glycosyltransferase